MPYYYVTHPNLGFSATIEAPSTEKARTVYLDYMERKGRVSRSSRQDLRRNMVADRIADPGEVYADISLAYGYEETSFKPEYREPASVVRDTEPEVEDPGFTSLEGIESSPESRDPESVEEEEFTREPSTLSPIQELSLGGYK